MPHHGEHLTRIIPTSGKIYDITHPDALEHSVALPVGYPENTRAIWVSGRRIVGAGNFEFRSVSGQFGHMIGVSGDARGYGALWFRADDGLFYYRLTQPNDDWDIYCHGYITV